MWKNAVKSAELAHSITLNCSAIMVIPQPRKLKYMMKTQSKDIHCCATEDIASHALESLWASMTNKNYPWTKFKLAIVPVWGCPLLFPFTSHTTRNCNTFSDVSFISRSRTKRPVEKQEQRSALFIPEGGIRPPGSAMEMAHLAAEGNCVGWKK